MKLIREKIILIAIPALLFTTEVYAETQTINMNKVIELASKSPEVQSAEALSESAAEQHTADKRKIFMPKIGVNASYTHSLQDQGLKIPPIGTPFGTLTPPPVNFKRDSTMGSVGLVQPIIDPENMLYSVNASKHSAEAEKLKASRQKKESQGEALLIYLSILELRAKQNSLEMFVNNLKSRQPEIRRLYEIGYVSESDVLKVKLGIDDANQGIREIIKKEDFLGQVLANLLGEEKACSPQELAEDLPTISNRTESIDPAMREDIQSLDKQLSAIEETKKASKASYLPKLSGFANHMHSDNDMLNKKDSDSVGVMLSWSIFDGGVKLSEARSNEEKKRALEQTKFLASANIKASYQDSLNMLKIKKQEFDERKSAVIDAKKVSEIEFRRLKTGKTTVNNLIDAEDTLKDRIEKASLSKVSWYQAWFNSQITSGEAISAPWEK